MYEEANNRPTKKSKRKVNVLSCIYVPRSMKRETDLDDRGVAPVSVDRIKRVVSLGIVVDVPLDINRTATGVSERKKGKNPYTQSKTGACTHQWHTVVSSDAERM